MKMTQRLQGSKASDLPRFLDSVLQRTDQISQTMDEEIVEQHIVVVDETVRLLRILRDSSSNINASDKETLDNLSSAFSDVLSALQQCSARAAVSPTTVAKNVCPRLKSGEPGKPAFDISAELLEVLLGLGFTYIRIAQMLEVSRWTISRRIKDYGLEDFRSFRILNVEDPIQHFALHTMFIPRVNNSLRQFSEAFNNHAVSTEGNWTPYKIWMNGMMHANNPLAHGDVDGEPDDIQFYGYDPEGPSPSEEDNNVV
ncbi:unnamed protein product, partial [Porites lobata]